ncbi:MAG: hypothetical protein AABW59_04285 [archaeon]
MPQHKSLFLASIAYSEQKREIHAEFAGKSGKLVKRYPFFPFTILPSTIPQEKLKSLLLSVGIKRFSIEQRNNLLVVSAVSFSDLKKIGSTLSTYSGLSSMIIEPERAFLLQKNWAYFDCFYEEDGEMRKEDSLPSPDLGFFVAKQIPFPEAMRLDEEQSLFILRRNAWASALKISPDKIPASAQERTEIMLENMFFKNGGTIYWSDKFFSQSGDRTPKCCFDKASSLDFSLVWSKLLSRQFFNLGPDTLSCDCCKPVELNDSQIIPSSMIEVSFQENNYFFESSSNSFALGFHKLNPGREFRLMRQKENSLTIPPIGPFCKNQKALLLVNDAKRLLDEGAVTLEKNHSMQWACTKKESFFSIEVQKSLDELSLFAKIVEKDSSNLFSKKDAGFFFAALKAEALNELLCELPLQLTNRNSKFFSPDLARAVISIQESTFSKFKEFSARNGYRVLHTDKKSAFIKGYSSLALAKKFSEELKIPQPLVGGFIKKMQIC